MQNNTDNTPDSFDELLWRFEAGGAERRLQADIASGYIPWRRERRAAIRRHALAAVLVAALVIPTGCATAQSLTLDMRLPSPTAYADTVAVSHQIVLAL